MNISANNLPDQNHAEATTSEYDYSLLFAKFQVTYTAKLVLKLINAVARHRGMSLSTLANRQTFVPDMKVLQKEINRRIAMLEAASEPLKQLHSINFDRIQQAWRTIESGWQQDTVRENFEYHSHFIELLQSIVARMIDPLTAIIDSRSHPQSLLLLTFCGRTMPELIELIARIRGLATYLLVSGNSDEQSRQRLSHFLKELKKQQYLYGQSVSRLNTPQHEYLPAISMIKTYELKLSFVLETVENTVLGTGQATLNGPQLFKISSEIIEIYQQVMFEGMDVLQKSIEQSIDNILQTGVAATDLQP